MSAIFYCENCGREVPIDAQVCPSCGKAFSSVRCPRCRFSGESEQFLQGCLQCGYLNTNSSGTQKGDHTRRKTRRFSFWIYLWSAGIIVIVFTALILLLFSL